METKTAIDLMAQMFEPGWAEETARIEDGCEISAGPNFGANLGAYAEFVRRHGQGIDPDRLQAFLRQELLRFPIFDEADVDAIARAALTCACNRVQAKFMAKETNTAETASQPAPEGMALT